MSDKFRFIEYNPILSNPININQSSNSKNDFNFFDYILDSLSNNQPLIVEVDEQVNFDNNLEELPESNDDLNIISQKSNYLSNKDLLKLDIEDLLKQEGITSINGKRIKFGSKALRSANASFGAKNSNHKKRDPHTGNAMARDISIIGGNAKDYEKFKMTLLLNPRVCAWMNAKKWGIINEITPSILKRTRGTGPHFHFGPDTWAVRTWNTWISNPNISVTQAI